MRAICPTCTLRLLLACSGRVFAASVFLAVCQQELLTRTASCHLAFSCSSSNHLHSKGILGFIPRSHYMTLGLTFKSPTALMSSQTMAPDQIQPGGGSAVCVNCSTMRDEAC